MEKKLFVGNLSYNATETDLKDLFEKHGEVKSVSIITDKYSGQSKGFAFVQMGNSADAEKALAENGADFLGRAISVSEARPPKQYSDRPRGGGGGGNRGGGGGGRGYGGGGGGGRGYGGGGGGRDRGDRGGGSRY